jgi:hypothetical protein
MSNAFEVTTDDILNVVHRMGKKISGDKAHEIHNSLDHFQIENEALRTNDLQDQTDVAYQEIERQIKEEELL